MKNNLKSYGLYFVCKTTSILFVSLHIFFPQQAFSSSSNNMSTFAVWDSENNPSRLGIENFIYKYSALPKNGSIGYLPWADTYWPSYNGGIAWRWQSLIVHPIDADFYSFSQIKGMTQLEVNELSPSEKFDIFLGDETYSFSKAVRKQNELGDVGWSGICHGWAQAALAYVEPEKSLVRTTTGISIPFASSDKKALLSYWMGEVSPGKVKFVGKRCEGNAQSGGAACEDLNAGAFHLVLANLIGLQKKGLVADLDPNFPIWNFPIYEFSTKEISSSEISTLGVSKEIETTLKYPNLSVPRAEGFSQDANQYNPETLVLRYKIELNSVGNIVGGSWITERHPDFVWTQEKVSFSGKFARLAEILKPN